MMLSMKGVVSRPLTWCIRRKSFLQLKNFSTSSKLLVSNEAEGNFESSFRSSTVDDEEVARFSSQSHTFWNECGEYEALHRMNDLRVPLIRDAIAHDASVHKPLTGLRIADIGCGGGVLAEPLARLGANVVAVDASEENIEVAKSHLSRDLRIVDRVEFVCATVEDVCEENKETFDAVVASEVLEHVQNPEDFVSSCAELVKPDGSLFVTTISRTQLAWLLGVVVAENIMRLVPAGTHDWQKFIKAKELRHILQNQNCSVRLCQGMFYNPINRRWYWTRNTLLSYAIHAIKHS